MYLSRVEIDTNNRQKISALQHLGAYHNWVEQSFPEEIKEQKRLRHLWRIDALNGKLYLLVLSEEKPDLEKLEAYGVKKSAMTKDYDAFLNKLQEGQVLRFRLTANPTRKISRPGHKQGRVVPHVTIDKQKEWFLQKATKNGFEVVSDPSGLNFNIVDRDWKLLRHKGNQNARLSCVTYEGILKISDLKAFKNALVNGIGREKAYGMGLLTVIPR
ncbi:type I-E CRISPR-associated protein Cas6/Cse3/CasE [uncultured Lactobacillus sp.]|uniref:type I-E CRISPR-associated protein Cas6/Cse3/CasE n=1 Tax=uncultured Lactobacillus sp. TaxID=153152 RepID=UPI002617D68D|nr:type I-E CRISPR-associated protein Cas6/Cse3/CasE [uncultured Lactobacillus sp.]